MTYFSNRAIEGETIFPSRYNVTCLNFDLDWYDVTISHRQNRIRAQNKNIGEGGYEGRVGIEGGGYNI